MRIIQANELKISDLPELHFAKPKTWRNRSKYAPLYKQEICAFDIETTTIEPLHQAVMYVWQFAIGTEFVVIGRTWDEFEKLLKLLNAVTDGNKLVCYVHNLSYEMQFLSGIFEFSNEDVFCPDSRKILRAYLRCLELRCSYYLTNLSLKELTRRYNVQHAKIDGDLFDYDKVRYPWTPLTELEQRYIINDVIGLIESIQVIMELNNDDVYSLPLTATGFVRRECREAMRYDHQHIVNIYPDYEVFKLLRAEFRGGNTHANRYYAGEIIEGVIHSRDISSSYPSAQCNYDYPVTQFKPVKNLSIKRVNELIEHNRAVLFEVRFTDVELRNKYTPVPYIPIAKCSYYRSIQNDNGRILWAKTIQCVINDIDWKIIDKQYKIGKIEVLQAYTAWYGSLPQGLIDSNVKFFKKKTELKGIDGQELFYMKNKELLNSIYGMSVQNPAKAQILFDDCGYNEDVTKTEEELLLKSRKKAFIAYQFGCWTTAHARAALEAGIDLCGDGLIYVDTDSCKYIGEADFSQYNEQMKQRSLQSGLYATDRKGVVHYGGVFEQEADMSAFITHGAKKYAYTDMEGKLHLTVSGVGKRKGAADLEAHGGLKAFEKGYVFKACGKTASVYTDSDFGWFPVDGREIYISRNVVIEDQDYTLSRTENYDEVLKQARRYLSKSMEILKNTTKQANF